jgi:hypothetical protein
MQATTNAAMQNLPKWRKFVLLFSAVFGLTAGLCTVFALVVTSAQAWQEHVQAQWPEATAQVQHCALEIHTYQPKKNYWINCNVSYEVHGDEVLSRVHSLSTPAPELVVVEYPAGQFSRMQEWVDAHPPGTLIRVHYNPANHADAVLIETDMPRGGPQTANNLKLLGFLAAACSVLMIVARIARP